MYIMRLSSAMIGFNMINKSQALPIVYTKFNPVKFRLLLLYSELLNEVCAIYA